MGNSRQPRFPFLVFTAVLLSIFVVPAHAQEYPSKPIKIIVPYSAGGGADTIARFVALGLSQNLGQQVIIETGLEPTVALGQNLRRDPLPTVTPWS